MIKIVLIVTWSIVKITLTMMGPAPLLLPVITAAQVMMLTPSVIFTVVCRHLRGKVVS